MGASFVREGERGDKREKLSPFSLLFFKALKKIISGIHFPNEFFLSLERQTQTISSRHAFSFPVSLSRQPAMADANRGSGGSSIGGSGEQDDLLAAPVEKAAPSASTPTVAPPSESEWKQALDSVVPCVVVLK